MRSLYSFFLFVLPALFWIGCGLPTDRGNKNNPTEQPTVTIVDGGSVVFLDGGSQAQDRPSTTQNDTPPAPLPDAAQSSQEPTSTPDAGQTTPDTPQTTPDQSSTALPDDKPRTPELLNTTSKLRWIGEPCTDDSECDYPGGFCQLEKDGYKGGHCSTQCNRYCPDKAGKAFTLCITDDTGHNGQCVSRCDTSIHPGTGCRSGYTCETKARFGQTSVKKGVCVPESTKPPVRSQWIGEPCVSNEECDYAGGYCLMSAGYKDGHCSLDCTSSCPDKTGKPYTLCIANSQGKGHCVSQCCTGVCRDGYQCVSRSRINDATRVRNVCIPQGTTPPPPPPQGSYNFLFIGDSQSSGSKFAYKIVDYLKQPAGHCTTAKSSNNKVASYAKPSSACRHWAERSGSSKNWLCGASTVYTNGTASSNTTGAALCSGITSSSKSIFEKRVEVHKPNAFVVALGDNSLGFSSTYVKNKVNDMLNQMPAGSLCFWIAPTVGATKYMTKKRNMEGWIRDAINSNTHVKCHLITTISELSSQSTCSSFNVSDGLHMTSCGSELWATTAIKKMCALQAF
ncbi:MAG TPA: hypothetical protein DCE42_27285 [Myxococcales bacterium]|nr:hypothetical protein [Deltaproteobacteria bacterium]HAA58496.1 hypothetical protein [Myxococcales bacterium]|tara:strand:+ start:4937 stop:6631 length:1695 start_codon:yes stop_codon:yes gene_type:complete